VSGHVPCKDGYVYINLEVVKIESAFRVDPVRPLEPVPPDRPGVNSGGDLNNLNTDKYSVTLNLGSPRARELVRRLVALNDVVFENFAGLWVMKRWGLDYASLARINPRLIIVSMPAIGPNGPLSHYRALGNHLQAMLGAHTAEALQELLGLSDDEVSTLVVGGAVE
jgi:benzylsuccinate CoA-transferase BbsF subunit